MADRSVPGPARSLLAAGLLAGALLLSACGERPAAAGEGSAAAAADRAEFALVIHGGAGTIRRASMTPERDAEYRAALEAALVAGRRILAGGGSAVDAVVATVQVMEESPLFNAGHGAVFTSDGENELDASIMDGETRNAGSVAGVRRVRSPIALARAVMDSSEHVMFAREGAERFAEEQGLEMVDPSYFHTDARWEALQRAREAEAAATRGGAVQFRALEEKLGTVGAVALDRNGNLAAATSTGGMTNKRFGRVGDSPVIGAGTYADNWSCAVSATGHGEYFIRNVVAHDICARMKHGGVSLREAADEVILRVLPTMDATGGVIAMDARGTIAMPFNTEGMYRGFILADGAPVVLIYRDEEQ